MKGLKEIGSFFSSIHGILTTILLIGSLFTLYRSHVINNYIKENKPLNDSIVTKIVQTEIVPLKNQLQEIRIDQVTTFNFLQDVIWNENLLQKNVKILMLGKDTTAIKILNKLNEFRNVELKPEFKIGVQKVK
jgi:hypothetical protein